MEILTKWPTHAYIWPTNMEMQTTTRSMFLQLPMLESLKLPQGGRMLGEDRGGHLPHGSRHWNWLFPRCGQPNLWTLCGRGRALGCVRVTAVENGAAEIIRSAVPRQDSSESRKREGIGLGLAVTRRVRSAKNGSNHLQPTKFGDLTG